MKLEYYAHACFAFTDGQGRRVLIDPYDASVGYPVPARPAHATVISHDHFDHNNLAAVTGATEPVRHPRTAAGIVFGGILADHDAQGGTRLGKVRCFTWSMDGIRIGHLGDLGRTLTDEEVAALGPVQLLLVPCGGGDYTLDAAGAHRVIAQIAPRWAVPMHYRTPFLNKTRFPDLAPLSAFTDKCERVVNLPEGEMILSPPTNAGPTEILCLPHKL